MKDLIITAKIAVYALTELSEEDKNLVEQAKKATGRSYAPYSGFQVGAALLLDNGVTLTGANQENAAFSSGTCAERSVIFYAGANYPGVAFSKLAIAAYTRGAFVAEPVPPCGHCRQAILEYENRAGRPVELLLVGADKVYKVSGIKDLLPLSFNDF